MLGAAFDRGFPVPSIGRHNSVAISRTLGGMVVMPMSRRYRSTNALSTDWSLPMAHDETRPLLVRMDAELHAAGNSRRTTEAEDRSMAQVTRVRHSRLHPQEDHVGARHLTGRDDSAHSTSNVSPIVVTVVVPAARTRSGTTATAARGAVDQSVDAAPSPASRTLRWCLGVHVPCDVHLR